MSVLSGHKNVKKYIKQSDGYKLLSHWTSSQSVEMDDGTTLEEKITSVNNTLDKKIDSSLIGTNNGIAELDANGFVPSSQLPSFVDDVIEGYFYNNEFYNESEHTTTIAGESGKIYIDLSTNKTYRWSGSAFVVISETLALGETSSTAYRGDRGKIAYDHSQVTHAPSNAEANQNAFSSVVVYNSKNQSTSIASSYPTDNITFKAGDNVDLNLDKNSKTITISSGANDANTSISYVSGQATCGLVSCSETGVEISTLSNSISCGETGIEILAKSTTEDTFYAEASNINLLSNEMMELNVGSNASISADSDGEVSIASTKTSIYTSYDKDFTINNKSIFDLIYPVGSIYMSVNSYNPSSVFGGTWVKWGSGRVPVGVDVNDSNFDTIEKTGGEATHLLTGGEIPAHAHPMNHTHTTPATTITSSGAHNHANFTYNKDTASGTAKNRACGNGESTAATNLFAANSGTHVHTVPSMTTNSISTENTGEYGGSLAHNNLQPYITCYMWKRTA